MEERKKIEPGDYEIQVIDVKVDESAVKIIGIMEEQSKDAHRFGVLIHQLIEGGITFDIVHDSLIVAAVDAARTLDIMKTVEDKPMQIVIDGLQDFQGTLLADIADKLRPLPDPIETYDSQIKKNQDLERKRFVQKKMGGRRW